MHIIPSDGLDFEIDKYVTGDTGNLFGELPSLYYILDWSILSCILSTFIFKYDCFIEKHHETNREIDYLALEHIFKHLLNSRILIKTMSTLSTWRCINKTWKKYIDNMFEQLFIMKKNQAYQKYFYLPQCSTFQIINRLYYKWLCRGRCKGCLGIAVHSCLPYGYSHRLRPLPDVIRSSKMCKNTLRRLRIDADNRGWIFNGQKDKILNVYTQNFPSKSWEEFVKMNIHRGDKPGFYYLHQREINLCEFWGEYDRVRPMPAKIMNCYHSITMRCHGHTNSVDVPTATIRCGSMCYPGMSICRHHLDAIDAEAYHHFHEKIVPQICPIRPGILHDNIYKEFVARTLSLLI